MTPVVKPGSVFDLRYYQVKPRIIKYARYFRLLITSCNLFYPLGYQYAPFYPKPIITDTLLLPVALNIPAIFSFLTSTFCCHNSIVCHNSFYLVCSDKLVQEILPACPAHHQTIIQILLPDQRPSTGYLAHHYS